MKFLISTFVIVVGKYCLAAGLDEVSDKISPRMDQMSGLRRMTQRASNQTRQSYAWNHDADPGGPYYCGDGVYWQQGGTGFRRYGGLCLKDGEWRWKKGDGRSSANWCAGPTLNGCSYGCSYSGASARYYCWRTPGSGGGDTGRYLDPTWCWVNVRCPSEYPWKECKPAKAWTLNCYGEREMMDQVIEEEKMKDRVNE